MIPPNGSINIIGNSGTLPNGALSGDLTIAFSNATGRNPTELIVLGGATSGGAIASALTPIRVSPFVFLRNLSVSGVPNGSRIIAKESPVNYTVTSFTWASNVLTINISPALPVATIVGQTVTVSGASVTDINGVYTATNISTSTVNVTLNKDPGTLTGVTGFIKPGIVDVAPNGSTAANARGYYTINMPVTAASSGVTGTTPCWTTQIVPANTTHVWAQASTNDVGELFVENVGTIIMPTNQLVSYRNLRSGAAFVADGNAGTDITILYYATLNPFGNP